ncbi:MAG: biopolymer transporter ExbD [Bacteroidales bacterium]|nr:biopolymer transporter ExbD [Bacteroidales bacterium]
MKLRKKSRYSVEVSTSSMNDIMFFLMLFFLIMSTLLNPSIVNLTLPNAKNVEKKYKKEITISVTKDLKYYVNNTEIGFGNLESVLAAELKKTQDATVVLRVDNVLTVQDLVNILQIGNKLKVKMILATKGTDG